MATWKGRQPAGDAGNGLPAELLAGPDVTVWAPDPLPENYVGRPADQHERSVAYRAWRKAGDDWNTAQGLPHQQWRTLLPGPVAYCATALGRAHVIDGGLQAPWRPRTPT